MSTQHFSTRPTLSPMAGNANSPVPIEVREPDFNKAIASVIWLRHHRQPTSRVFNCLVSNCPLCPTSSSTERPSSAKLGSVPRPKWRLTSEADQTQGRQLVDTVIDTLVELQIQSKEAITVDVIPAEEASRPITSVFSRPPPRHSGKSPLLLSILPDVVCQEGRFCHPSSVSSGN
ncbi:uncharacterized protein LOC121426507 [Lytechinus variegatus]|uniref:uncharacterized protein LOC121426507 n=1 Tax=Lytechinus variegatus TaxID=7654 RepID=UPI001BB1D8B0|nr:uncharacterized protein LOC121426507 [Lytechinus variegatus]